jgi:hypothetical protein
MEITNRFMDNLFKSNYFWLFYSISLTLFSFNLFLQWGLMVGVLFAIFLGFRWTRLETDLSLVQWRSYVLAIFLYPPIETSIIFLRIKGKLPPDFDFINRGEHFCWAIALIFFFLPLIAGFWKSLNGWQNLILILGFVCLLGNFNEFLEYLFRIQPSSRDNALFASFYHDTILDMTMNLLGGLVGFAILTRLFAKPRSAPSASDR